LAVPDAWIPAAAVARLLHLSAAESKRADFALRLAQQRRLATLGPLSIVLREEPDLRHALQLLIRHEHSYNEALRMDLDQVGGVATMRLRMELGKPVPTAQALELATAALVGIIRALMGEEWRPLSVCFSHRPPPDIREHQHYFGTLVRFDHEFTGLVIRAGELNRPTATADPWMRPYAQQFLESVVAPRPERPSERVRELVELLLPMGRCSMDRVAGSLNMDRRTLHRLLAKDGETFSGIVQSSRAALAERYLASDRYSLTEISQLLGFVTPSAFSHWFRSRFGTSPTQWRAQVRGDPPREGAGRHGRLHA
jgi:AraC-like DNA-binding protein